MIKSLKYYAFAASGLLLLGAASCSNEDVPQLVSEGDGNVTLQAILPADLATRAFGDGTQATKLCYAVYNAGQTTPISGMVVDGTEAITMQGLAATVNMKLVTGRSYDIIFWAESEVAHNATSNKPYTISWDGQTVDVDYTLASNDESRDAFFVKHTVEVNGPINETVTLRRPFAQINFGSDDLNEKAVIDAYGENLQTQLTTKAYTQLNLGSGEVANEEEVTFTYAGLPDSESFPHEPDTYDYVSMNYILVSATRGIADLKFEIKNETEVINTLTVAAAPVQRNFRTNIFGSLLTSTADFNVVIDPIFETPDNTMPILSGNTYLIESPAHLQWIAGMVNGGETLSGKVISIKNDLDLSGIEWTPIGNSKNVLAADIKGNGHTIKNLTISDGGEAVGFVGYTWRKVTDLTFDNADIKANHWAGVVVGLTQDGCPNFGIENVTVKNSTVETTPWLVDGNYDDGDKVGGIIGYYPNIGGSNGIKNCSVENVTVKGYRHVGGIAGYASYTMTGNTVKNVTIIQDFTNGYKAQSAVDGLYGAISGNNSSYDEGNSSSDVTFQQVGK